MTTHQPAELRAQPWRLFDEFDNEYIVFLTYELENAPRIMRITCRRSIEGVQFKLEPSGVYHDKQVQ